jgi:hypothetical protein
MSTVLSATRVTGSGNAAAAAATGTAARVWEALRSVRDPELDADVVSLDFVGSVEVGDDGVIRVSLRLPTYFCAPNSPSSWSPTRGTRCRPLPG